MDLRSQLDNKKDEVESEQKRIKELKKDLKDIKDNKENIINHFLLFTIIIFSLSFLNIKT